MTTTEAMSEKDDPEDLTRTTQMLAEEAAVTTRTSERHWQQIRRCVYMPMELTTAMVELTEKDGH